MESAGERNACRCVRSPDCMTAELRSWLIRGGMSMTDENREDDAAHHPKTRLSPCLQAARKACHAVSCFAIHAYRLNPRLSPSSCPHMTRDEEPARDESRAPPGLNLHACPQCVQPWRHDARRSGVGGGHGSGEALRLAWQRGMAANALGRRDANAARAAAFTAGRKPARTGFIRPRLPAHRHSAAALSALFFLFFARRLQAFADIACNQPACNHPARDGRCVESSLVWHASWFRCLVPSFRSLMKTMIAHPLR